MSRTRRVLVTGAAGQVGREVVEHWSANGDEVIGVDRATLDITDRGAVLGAIISTRPDVIVNCAAWTAVDACESDEPRAMLANALAVRWLTDAALRSGAFLITLSTDYVFDGTLDRAYHEWDAPNPASVYGRSKLAGEGEAALLGTQSAVVRTSWVNGFHGANMVKTILRLADERPALAFVDDQRGNPTLAADLAIQLRRISVERLGGVIHATNQGQTTWYDFARAVVAAAGKDPAMVSPIATADLQPPRPAPRPANSVLDNTVLAAAGIPLMDDFHRPLTELVQRLQRGEMRVAYTLEQCWHRVPGGTATAALHVAAAIGQGSDVELIGVAARHAQPPEPAFRPPIAVRHVPLPRPLLYESWLRLARPRVERTTGKVDVCHSTTIIPAGAAAPSVVTVHDLAFLHRPEHFTKRGNDVFRRSLAAIRRRADLVLCSSQATMDDCFEAGIGGDRLRHVPLGVAATPVSADEIADVRRRYALPERFALFVGTVEPRKNLPRLIDAVSRLSEPLALVVAGASGWGDAVRDPGPTRFVGFVPDADLAALYAGAAVFCYPSLLEGFGLPVLEAMVQGTPVVTSAGTSTEEAAGGNAVLVEATDTDSISAGIETALADADRLSTEGRAWAMTRTWAATAELTVAAYREVCG